MISYNKGEENPFFGKRHSEEARKKISELNIGRTGSEKQKMAVCEINKLRINEKNWNWKGDNVKYDALHAWIKKRLPRTQSCQMCKKMKKLDLSNISGTYLRDLIDWQWLCRSCHTLYDFKNGMR